MLSEYGTYIHYGTIHDSQGKFSLVHQEAFL